LVQQVLLAALLLPVIVAACSRVINGLPFTLAYSGLLLSLAAGAVACWLLLVAVLRRLRPHIEEMSARQARFLDSLPARALPWAVAGSAGASLALELAVIRWQGTVWEIFAFYKNYGLLSCFAGLGLGYALSRRDRIPAIASLPLLFAQVLMFVVLRHALPGPELKSLMATPVREQLNMGFLTSTHPAHLVAAYSFLGTVMMLTALAFVPVGQVCGRLLERMAALPGYGLNLLGSIGGTVFVMALSHLWTPPVLWFVPCAAVVLLLLAFGRGALVVGTLSTLAMVCALDWPVSFLIERVYSPYQLIERMWGHYGLMGIRAAGRYYQRVNDLTTSGVLAYPERAMARDYYELPYVLHPRARRVAIVGAGTGNDVAAALRRGAERVDAIEIDPAIMELGAAYHPEQPYSDPRVRRIVNDARTFLRSPGDHYDLIVYGLLDSHTLLSHASSVRLDSFVYTVEGLQDARRRLEEGGVVALSFSVMSPEIGRKIFLMMKAAFDGHPPVCIRSHYDGSVTFVQSKEGGLKFDPSVINSAEFDDVSSVYADPNLRADISTDDWPFFYMPQRVYPVTYMWMLGVVLALSVYLFASFLGARPQVGHGAFFFMGAGFMLVETKGITELGLHFGNTWHVIGFVILGILTMAYLANVAVLRFRLRAVAVPLCLVMAALGLGLGVSASGGQFAPGVVGQLTAVGLLTLPMLFSGVAFSGLLARTRDVPGALASNLFGAMCGGLLEYNSMYFGFQFLYWIAMACYGAALLLVLLKRPA
jgi:spermidine synthase